MRQSLLVFARVSDGRVLILRKKLGVTVKVCEVSLEDETISAPVTVRAYLNQTVAEFKQLVAQIVCVREETMRCVLERYYNELKLLLVPSKTLKQEGFVRSNKVFIECSGMEDDTKGSFMQTCFYKLLDRYENTIRIHITLPPFGKDDTPDSQSKQSTSSDEKPDSIDKSPDIDEGIDENEGDESNEQYNQLSDNQTSGPLKSANLGTQGQSDAHAYISDSIEKNLADLSPDKKPSMSSSEESTHTSSQTTSPEVQIPPSEQWDIEDRDTDEASRAAKDEEYRRYFTGAIHIDAETGDRNVTVYVDKRITFGAFKKELEPYVCASSDYFRVYRVYGSNQEIETVRLSDTLSAFGDDNKLVVKLGRALKKGEQRVKVCLLQPNEPEPWRPLLETIFPKGLTVLESKKLVLQEMRTQCGIDIPLERCRLRKKTYKNPGNIYLDDQNYEENMQVISFWEIFLEILDEAETKTSQSILQMYVRLWHPSDYSLGPIQEVTLEKQTSEELREKLSTLSGVVAENIEFAKGRGVFPYEVSLLDIHNDLDWSTDVPSLSMWPLHIFEDGNLIYYRDKTEKLVELDEARKKELTTSENNRLSRINTKMTYSPRKERALKIYTDDVPPQSSQQSASSLDVD